MDKICGKLYGVGVGPGDPKQMTYQAVETIEACPVIAVPADGKENAVSYKIASGIVKGLDSKECLDIPTPMTKDQDVLNSNYHSAADRIIEKLKEGQDVAYLCLGDPTIYATYIYIHRIVRDAGYDTEIISGIPSFCAVSARLNDSLCDRSEQLHIIPSSYDIEEALELPGNKILMKAASKLNKVKDVLVAKGADCDMVENCGMDNEKIHLGLDNMPDEGSYFTVVFVKER